MMPVTVTKEDAEILASMLPVVIGAVAQMTDSKTEKKKQEILQLLKEIEDELEL